MIPHNGGPIAEGYPRVHIGGLFAARLDDAATCIGADDTIAQGSPTVLIGGMPASRDTDLTLHWGSITDGFERVLIGDGSAVPGPPGETPLMVAIRTLLYGSETGREALAMFDSNAVGVQLAAGQGRYFDQSTNTMTLDPTASIVRSSLSFVHEMGHAEYYHEGKGADINDTKTNFVNGMIAEEADGVVRSIQTQQELADRGYAVSGVTYPLQNEYHAAYNHAVANEKLANPSATAAQLDAVGRQAGLARVEQGFHDGEVTTSNTGATYPDYYGVAHDKAHP